jgi:polyferredoxin
MKSAQKMRDWFYTRRGVKMVLWTILPAVIVAGFFWPVIGFSLLLCMAGAVVTSFWKGRAWCDVCPRGAFLDIVMKKIAGKRPIPQLLRHNAFRIGVLAFVMGMMGTRLAMTWGDANAMGFVFITLLTVTTLVGIALALFYNPRTWCVICPMGSMATWIGKKKQPLQVSDDACVSCGACKKACPMELNPEAHRQAGQMPHGDCLKCSACIVSCPKQALSWEQPA